jgi:hypothetical protein
VKGSGRDPQPAQRLDKEVVHSKLRDYNLRGKGRGPQQAYRLEFKREREEEATSSSETRI